MELDALKKIGLTDGEIKVYRALLYLGKSSTGDIMKKSGVSSSKVYLILERLMQKGLASFVVENNVKKFQAANPKAILDYANNKIEEMKNVEKELGDVVLKIASSLGKYEEESAQVYKGIGGIRVVFDSLLDEMEKGEEYYFFGISKEEISDQKVLAFLQNVHKKRVSKGIKVKGIVDIGLKELYEKRNIFRRLFSLRYYKLALPTGIVIGKRRIIIMLWGDENIAYEIISRRAADRYREFFDKLWEKAKK